MGPLSGLRIVEFAGIGPAPMCAMLLADLGADVLCIDRTVPGDRGIRREPRFDLLRRNRPVLALDLKQPAAAELVFGLLERADALIEGFRPGSMERLGFSPAACLARAPRLVYGRMTGWGQDGPLAQAAGHDLNYIALTGALDAIGRKGQPPTPPLNLVGNFGGGALYLALGLLAAIIEARSSGQGQVVDAAIVDGAASLMTVFHGLAAAGETGGARGENVLDSGAYFYDVYECADGRYVSVAPIEKRFHDLLLQTMGIDPAQMPAQLDRASWPRARAVLGERFRRKTQAEWCALLEGTDACFAPVLSLAEAPAHPHMRARGVFIEIDGVVQPAPAPRFSRTSPDMPRPYVPPGRTDPGPVLARWGFDAAAIKQLLAAGVVHAPPGSDQGEPA